MNRPRVSIIAALGRNRVIGNGDKLLWHIPDDLKRFKRLTMGHPIVMGRKTFESILAMTGGKPLPGRTNIVVTRDPRWEHAGTVAAHSLPEALERAREFEREEIFIGGGAQIYGQALPSADRLYLTLIEGDKEGDAFFPEYGDLFSRKAFEEKRDWNGLHYTWVDLER